jgi:hypothetical protein
VILASFIWFTNVANGCSQSLFTARYCKTGQRLVLKWPLPCQINRQEIHE